MIQTLLILITTFAMTQSVCASESSSLSGSGSVADSVLVDNDTISSVSFSNQIEWYTVPYVVGLRQTIASPNYCVGVLVEYTFVLTSNKCMPSLRTPGFTTQYAAIGTNYKESTERGERIRIVKWHSHPSYIANSSWFDFMLVELESATRFEPAFLAKTDHKFLAAGTSVNVYGWDDNGSARTIAQNRLMFKSVMSIGNTLACTKNVHLGGTEFCALGSDALDPCRINLGSPMIKIIKGYITVVGILTNRSGCKQNGGVTGFSHVELAFEWIKEIAKVPSMKA